MDGPPHHEAEDVAAEPDVLEDEDNDEEMESEDEVGDNEEGSDEGSFDDNHEADDDDDDDGSDAVSGWEDEEEDEVEETTRAVQRLFMAADLDVAVRQLEETRSTGMRPGSLTYQVKNRPMPTLRGDNLQENDHDDDNNNNDHGGDDRTAALFGRFVALLGGDQRLGQVAGTLVVEGYRFDQHDSFPAQDVDRLFGNVLRSLPALKNLKFEKCTLPGPCLGLLASTSLPPPSHNLTELELTECDIDSEGVAHVASMVRHSASRLRVLAVVPTSGGLDPSDCQVLCESVPHSRTLRLLNVGAKTVHVNTLDGAAGPGSPLKALYVTGAFTDNGVASLARQLRTNTRLIELSLAETSGDCRLYLHHLLCSLNSYNVTLRHACVYREPDGDRPPEVETFARTLERNRWIRTAIRRLEPRNYRLTPTGLWPLVFEAKAVGTFPTLLYRLLRRGDVDALCDVVQRQQQKSNDGNKKRVRAAGQVEPYM